MTIIVSLIAFIYLNQESSLTWRDKFWLAWCIYCIYCNHLHYLYCLTLTRCFVRPGMAPNLHYCCCYNWLSLACDWTIHGLSTVPTYFLIQWVSVGRKYVFDSSTIHKYINIQQPQLVLIVMNTFRVLSIHILKPHGDVIINIMNRERLGKKNPSFPVAIAT